jgi:hypothetical protein
MPPLALQPPYLQNLMNYPVVTAGIVMGPRGVSTRAAMLVVGRLTELLESRYSGHVASGATVRLHSRVPGQNPVNTGGIGRQPRR